MPRIRSAHRLLVPMTVIAASNTALAQPRYVCTLRPAATCEQQVPGDIISDSTTPTQNSFGPFVCSQFWGDGIMTASAFSSFGIVGVDIENLWTGCAAFGCGPALLQINSSASHEFDVVFSSPTNDPIDVRMNIQLSCNIQEHPGLYRIVNARVTGPGLSWSGRFGQVDQQGAPDVREGMFNSFDEITGSDVTTPEMVNVPVNTPVRFTMSIWVENASTLVTGGAVNFARGLRLQGTPFTVTGTAPGVSPGDIVVIDAQDLDRITADALVEANVAAVVNASASISGRYPNLGPEVLVVNGIMLVDNTGPEVFKKVKDGARIRINEGRVYSGDRRLINGTERTDVEIHELMQEAKGGLVAHL